MTLSTKTMLYLAQPIIVKVANEIMGSFVTKENLVAAQEKFLHAIRSITKSNDWVWDDVLVESIIEQFANAEFFQKYGDQILDPIEDWIKASETQWDDLVVLPAIVMLRDVAEIADND